MPQSPLIDFYAGGVDTQDRTLTEILAWSDDDLEFVDNFIQWLFPSQRASDFVDDAPVLTAADIELFLHDEALRHRLRHAFDRMLAFYGYIADRSGVEVRVLPSPRHAERLTEWVTRYNHNFRRISRILECLRTLGLPHEASAFFAALEDIYTSSEGPIVGAQTFGYWRTSALGPDA